MPALREIRARTRLSNPQAPPPGMTTPSFGVGLTVADAVVSADFGTGHDQVARGDAAGGGSTPRSGTLAARGSASTYAGTLYRVASGTGMGDLYASDGTAWALVSAARRMPLDASVVHRWPFDEGTGTTFADAGTGGNALTLTGSVDVASRGIVGGAIRFAGGATDRAVTASSPATPAAGAFSVAFAVRFSALPSPQYLITKLTGATWTAPYAAIAIYATGGTLGVGTNCGGTWDGGHSVAGFTAVVGVWYRIVVTLDGTTARVYVNDLLVDSWACAGDVTWGTGVWEVGGLTEAGAYGAASMIDEINVINSVWTAQQVSEDCARTHNLWTP